MSSGKNYCQDRNITSYSRVHVQYVKPTACTKLNLGFIKFTTVTNLTRLLSVLLILCTNCIDTL